MNDNITLGNCERNHTLTTLPPIFIDGYPRSGTTLLLNILGKNSQIYSTTGSNLFISNKLLFSRVTEKDIEVLFYNACLKILSIALGPDKVRVLPVGKEDIDNIIDNIKKETDLKSIKSNYDVYNLCLNYLTIQNKKLRWAERTHRTIFNTKNIFSIYPNAKILYVYRDPRAVYASISNTRRNLKLIDVSLQWVRFQNRCNKLKKRCLIYPIKYEELISEPTNTIKAICNYLEIPFENSMLDVTVYDSSFRINDTKKGFNKESTDLWKNHLPKNKILLIEFLTSRTMKEFGYSKTQQSLLGIQFFDFLIFIIREVLDYLLYKFQNLLLKIFKPIVKY